MPTRKKAKGKTKANARSPRSPRRPPAERPRRQKKAGESASPALITQESHADRERRGQTEAVRPVSTVGSSHTDAQPACATRSAGGAYRRRDPLLQSPFSRDPTARVRYTARWRRDPHPRTHHRPTKAVSFVISNDGRNVRYWHKADIPIYGLNVR